MTDNPNPDHNLEPLDILTPAQRAEWQEAAKDLPLFGVTNAEFTLTPRSTKGDMRITIYLDFPDKPDRIGVPLTRWFLNLASVRNVFMGLLGLYVPPDFDAPDPGSGPGKNTANGEEE